MMNPALSRAGRGAGVIPALAPNLERGFQGLIFRFFYIKIKCFRLPNLLL
jgi:hypothetical protein